MRIFRDVLELLGCGALVFDEGLEVQFANRKAGELFGVPPKDLLHRSLQEIDAIFMDPCGGVIPDEQRPLMQAVSLREKLAGRELALKQPGGTLVMVALNAAPFLEDDGRLSGLVADLTDISAVKNLQRENLQTRQRLSRFIGSMDEIAFEFDAEGRYLHIWSGDESLLKMPRHELLGKRLHEVIPRELAEQVLSAFLRIRKTGEPETLEYPMEVLGGPRWFLARMALVPSRDEEDPTFSFLARDITKLKKAEESLQESQRRFRGFFDIAATGMALVGLNGRCLEANPCFCEMIGHSLEELRQKSFISYSHPEDYPAEIEQFRRLVRGEINSYRMEKRFIRKDGELIWGHLTVALQRDEEETPLYSVAVVENITQRKQLEAKKDLLLNELNAIFASTAEGIIFCDAEKILRANPAALEISGVSEIKIEDLYKIIAPQLPDGTFVPFERSALYSALHGTARKNEVVRIRHQEGRQVWISFSASPVMDASGRQLGTVGTIGDITQLRELQERMENYLHILAHELGSPLTLISGHAQILQEALRGTNLEEKSHLSTRTILSASDQINQMLKDLVDFGRLESGHISLHHDAIDLRDFVIDFLARQQVADEYRRVRVQGPEDLPQVRIGTHHLERILGNLISNALKYSEPDQPVEIEISHERCRVCLAVQDHGQGIAPEDLPHIFERFYRSRINRQKAGGTGLGLFITKSLLVGYGGDIRVKSAPGRGARFTIGLPSTSCVEK